MNREPMCKCNNCNTVYRLQDLTPAPQDVSNEYKKEHGFENIKGYLLMCPQCGSVDVVGVD